MSAQYRAGLIGCGAMSGYHLTALKAQEKVETVALADISEDRLQAVGAQWNITSLYRDFQEMLGKESLDIVVIATQAPVHCIATVAAAEAGAKGILCEKPMALDLNEADRMVTACEHRGALLAINHQMRLNPGTLEMQRLVREGAIGHLRMVNVHDKGGRPAGNALMEIGTHLFDLMRLFAGEVEWVYGDLVTRDGRPVAAGDIMPSQKAYPKDRDCGLVAGERAFALFGFLGGVRGTFEALGMKPASGAMYGIDLIGDEGRILRRGGFDASVWLYQGADWTPERPMECVWSSRQWSEAPSAGIVYMVADLIKALEEGREPACSGMDGRATLEMVMGIYESHHKGSRVMLPLEDRSHPLARWQGEETEIGW